MCSPVLSSSSKILTTVLHNHQTGFLIATQYGHINSRERAKTFNMNYTQKITNKWALPGSALPVSPPQPALQGLLFHEDTQQSFGDASGTQVGTRGVRWSWGMVLVAHGCQALHSCPRELHRAALRPFRHPWDARTSTRAPNTFSSECTVTPAISLFTSLCFLR